MPTVVALDDRAHLLRPRILSDERGEIDLVDIRHEPAEAHAQARPVAAFLPGDDGLHPVDLLCDLAGAVIRRVALERRNGDPATREIQPPPGRRALAFGQSGQKLDVCARVRQLAADEMGLEVLANEGGVPVEVGPGFLHVLVECGDDHEGRERELVVVGQLLRGRHVPRSSGLPARTHVLAADALDDAVSALPMLCKAALGFRGEAGRAAEQAHQPPTSGVSLRKRTSVSGVSSSSSSSDSTWRSSTMTKKPLRENASSATSACRSQSIAFDFRIR